MSSRKYAFHLTLFFPKQKEENLWVKLKEMPICIIFLPNTVHSQKKNNKNKKHKKNKNKRHRQQLGSTT